MEKEIVYTGIEKNLWELCIEVIKAEGLDLYDLAYIPGSKKLMLFIENPDTGTALIEDCVRVDRALTTPFEEADWIPEDIRLEVSSPGIERVIRSKIQFEKNIDKGIEVKLNDLSKIEEKMIKGKLLEVKEDEIILQNAESEDQLIIGFEEIKKAKLDYLANMKEND